MSEPFGYFKAEPFGWTDCDETDEGAVALYEGCKDKHVEAVRQKMLERSQRGLSKYGVNLERNDLTTLDWLRHAQEEAMDLAAYLQVLIDKEEQK